MRIDPVKDGIVIDHIKSGKAMRIYDMLSLDKLDCSVAVLCNVPSKLMGRKDIIKIDMRLSIDFDILGVVSPDITVNFVENGEVIEKRKINPPEIVEDVLVCENPHCITSVEQEIHHIFKLADKNKGLYRCVYCETEAKGV